MVYTDLDNDGDMDMVVNNINDAAFCIQNTLMDNEKQTKLFNLAYLEVIQKPRWSWCVDIYIYYGTDKQVLNKTPYRGYLSSVDIRHILV